ncbi:CCHC-type domain-containing protein [Trichonephila inaurata madagascariensis]|uniref:CCHC-type domain-containing protein n=1 Tax=Trichonephila inaurata madagascariensis TaxID=2747483 RepID=A0A8X6XNC1_9ARAC|nr:CCHC-type domain-containing protein [Trichonephila inaurata madagascariensis]
MKYKEFASVYSPSPLQSAFDFCIDSEGTQLETTKKVITCLCDFEILKDSLTTEEILEEETDELRKCDQSVQYENKSCYDNVFKIDSSVNSINNKFEQKIIVSFNDIESVITPFKGERHENVLHWIENFEAQSELLSLSEVHKFIYAKKCLRGNASLVVRSETGINSWKQLKDLLMEEFKISFNSAEVHEMLQKHKMKCNESPLEYFYSMKEISQQSNIDDQALITYIIKGINDSTQNKIMLFGCTSIIEFKTKLRVYETYKREMKQSESFNRVPNVSNEVGKRSQIHCYYCQQQGHKSYECKAKIRTPNLRILITRRG